MMHKANSFSNFLVELCVCGVGEQPQTVKSIKLESGAPY